MNDYITQELSRIVNRIPHVDPASSDYHMLLASLEGFYNLAEVLEEILSVVDVDPDEGKIIQVEFRPSVVPCSEDCATCDRCSGEEEAPILSSNSTDSVTAGENTTETVEEAAESPSEKVEKRYDPADVRRALLAAKRRGVDLTQVFHSVGASNFSNLPPEKYAEVMAQLGEES